MEYELQPESTAECEWDTFIAGSQCAAAGTQVIIQKGGVEDGFHWAHLCDTHAQPALAEVQGNA